MNEGMTSQKNQREYLKAIKNNGIIIVAFVVPVYIIIAVLDYILL